MVDEEGTLASEPTAGLRDQQGSSSIERPDYWWYRQRTGLLHAVFGPMLSPDARVLDVGSADGPSVGWLADGGLRIPVDIDPRGLRSGGVCADALRLPFGDACVDVVAAFDVIEHFADEAAIVTELVRVLRPQGILAISVPAYQWAWSPFDVAAGHHRRYTRQRLRQALRGTPLDIMRVTHAFAGVFPFFAVARLAERIRPSPPSTSLPTLPGPLETLLLQLGRVDAALLPRHDLSFGSSILLLARKRG